MSGTLTIHTLGSVSIQRDGQPLKFDTRKSDALLIYLSCTQRAHPRDVLAEMLYEHRTQSQGLSNLRGVLTDLRKHVGEYLEITRDTAQLSAERDIWLDVVAFESQLEASEAQDVTELEAAIKLYEGDFLAGFYVDSETFEDWARLERERLRLRVMEALDTLITCYLRQCDYQSGISAATRLLTIDSLREETHRQLMDLLWCSGQRGRALEQYERCCQVLQDELGIAPLPETIALYERIKAGQSPDEPEVTIRSYELRERIGVGEFGEVWRAFQPVVNRDVAVKVIKPDYANQPDFVRRFETEAQLVARLEHPNIVPLYDYWRDPTGAYLVMRYLRGGNLRDWVKDGPLALEDALRVMEQVARALDFAHRHAIIHRDIKPTNILLDEERNAFLTDFGLAKVMGHASSREGLLGTPEYISPEQIQGQDTGPPSDLYSLGLVLYEMLAGEPAFRPSNMAEMVDLHLHTPVPDLTARRDDLPDTVNAVIQTATAKTPSDRYTGALALARALREALAVEPATAVEGDAPLVETLTERESEVLRLMAEGLCYRDIAAQLVLAESTVAWYRRQIFGKLGVSKRREAIAVAQRLGLLEGAQVLRKDVPIPLDLIGTNPYKGLQAFTLADAGNFFGRDALVAHLVSCLRGDGNLQRFLAVVGPSGSGKSSVVKAGLLPRLMQGAVRSSEDWFVVDMQPGAYPLDRLEVALMRVATKPQPGLMEQLQRDARGLSRAADLILPDEGELLLVIDQFEELFTLVEDPAVARHVLSLIHAAVTYPRSNVHVIITLRADFFDRPLVYPDFYDIMRHRTEIVGPLTAEELEAAIVRPAELAGVVVEPGLVAALVAEVSEQPGTLPLLEYALTELFDRREGRTMTLAAYHELGGALGALARRADDRFEELSAVERDAARQMFLRLVTLGEGTEDVRRRVLRSELEAVDVERAVMEDVLEAFDEDRLMTFDFDPATREPTVEVAHEALIQRWGRLRDWLDASRDDVRLQRMLATAANEWISNDRDTDFLLRGARLAQFADWAGETDIALTGDERVFLEASITEETLRRARRRRTRRLAFAAISLVAVVLAVLALWANSQRNRAEDEKAHAETAEQEALRQASIGLAALAQRELENGEQDRAVLLALEALDHYPYTSQAESALADAIEAYVPNTGNLRNNAIFSSLDGFLVSIPLAFFWSPDSTRLATIQRTISSEGSDVDMILVTDVSLTSLMFRLSLNESGCAVHDIAWAPGGERLASIYTKGLYSTSDCSALPTIWDASTGERLFQLSGHDGQVSSIEWSADGTAIITAGEDGTVRVWDAQDGRQILSITEPGTPISDAVWSPDGQLIATASSDGTARIWNAETGRERLVIRHTAGVFGVDWSPNGVYIATAGEDGLARIWETETGTLIHALHGDTTALLEVVYSPDGTRIATRSDQNLTKIWDTATGRLILSVPWVRRSTESWRVTWSPDGQVIGALARIWDISKQPVVLAGHTTLVTGGLWTPDGSRIVTTSMDRTARIWDALTGEELHVLEHPNTLHYASLSPDGTRLVTSCWDGNARIWDIATGELLLVVPLSAPEALLFDAVWSPDGSRITSTDMTAHNVVFDAHTGEIVATLNLDAALSLLDVEHCFLFGPTWSPDSTRIATGCENISSPLESGPLIWDAASGELLSAFEGIGSGTRRVDWSPDGRYLAAGQAGDAFRIWDAASGELLQSFTGTFGGYAVTWSPSGTRLATGTQDGLVKVWDPVTGAELRSLQTPGNVLNIDWSPDERYIIIVGDFETPIIRRVWPSTQALITEARDCCVSRELTREEREQFDLPPREEWDG